MDTGTPWGEPISDNGPLCGGMTGNAGAPSSYSPPPRSNNPRVSGAVFMTMHCESSRSDSGG